MNFASEHMASQIREHMEVVDASGAHVGTVDHLDGEQIKLTKQDSADGQHHFIPVDLIAKVDDQVHLNLKNAELKGKLH